jgi:hypothetical protein
MPRKRGDFVIYRLGEGNPMYLPRDWQAQRMALGFRTSLDGREARFRTQEAAEAALGLAKAMFSECRECIVVREPETA